jgi:peptidoglycan/xylan/chitin deacetylase (PgdA/CDA1 family)
MTWECVKEMSKYKISFQSHSCTHQDLTSLENGIVMRELLRSREIIEEKLGFPIRHFSYPYGCFDQRIKHLAKRAGYLSACAVSQGDKDEFERERLMITLNDNRYSFALKASGWAGWIRAIWHKVRKPEYRP